MALLHAVLDVVHHEFAKKEPKWKSRTITPDDIEFLEEECATASKFDPFGWRREMYQKYKKGTAELIVRECEYGRVIAIGEKGISTSICASISTSIPWGLWGRILRLYTGGRPARIFFLASPYLRTIPQKRIALGPANINGGYTYTCNNQTIVIYRAEDATRVLIHELQHASCLDHHEDGVDLVEAETEAWAELLYAGMLSQGKPALFYQLVKRQADWMQTQNEVVKRHITRHHQFPWRYTVGKEDVWKRWGLIEEDVERNTVVQHELRRNSPPGALVPTRSLRLTPPPTTAIKDAFGVDSNII